MASLTTTTPFLSDLPLTSIEADSTITQQLAPLLISARRHLHMHPEVGFQEYETARFIREMLETHGLKPHGPVAGTGLYVDIEGEQPGPAVGYRADIDALPIQDQKQVPYASRQPGVAHLCGHDAHTSVGIGVALLLHQLRERLPGKVRVFFQPNEEGNPSGAPLMIRDGVLDGLEAVYAIHVDPTLEAGRYGLITGPSNAAADQIRITVRGESTGHAARPHEAVDTVWIATQIANALYQLVGRVTDARDRAVFTICRFEAGTAYNVIPAKVEFGGTLRSTTPESRIALKQRITETTEQIAALYGGQGEVKIGGGSPVVVNDPVVVRHVRATIKDLFSPQAIYDVPLPSMGSEDFAHYLERVPGILLRVGISSGEATCHPLHDTHSDLDEQILAPTAQLMAHILLRHLERRILDA